MARNEEKQFGKLNRLYLQKEKEEQALKNPKRPNLNHLNTVDEIKEWLPSIKRDIDFNLKQSQVLCYSDAKVTELHGEVAKLEKEYKSFVRKIKQVDSSIGEIPWTNRPYEPQHRLSRWLETDWRNTEGYQIPTPILSTSNTCRFMTAKPGFNYSYSERPESPLHFDLSEGRISGIDPRRERNLAREVSPVRTHSKFAKFFNRDLTDEEEVSSVEQWGKCYQTGDTTKRCNMKQDNSVMSFKDKSLNKIWTGVDYSSSSSDEN